ncbi:hypothetical protein SK128_006324, partial [Halocaridina rubra]
VRNLNIIKKGRIPTQHKEKPARRTWSGSIFSIAPSFIAATRKRSSKKNCHSQPMPLPGYKNLGETSVTRAITSSLNTTHNNIRFLLQRETCFERNPINTLLKTAQHTTTYP